MNISRRKALMSALFGAGYVGLRALATGIPAGILLKGRRAFADGAVATTDDDGEIGVVALTRNIRR